MWTFLASLVLVTGVSCVQLGEVGLNFDYNTEYASHYDNYKPRDYHFDYAVSDPHTGDHKSQWEVKEKGVVRGMYSLLEPDGTTRIVEYIADDHGFRAVVKKIGHGIHPQVEVHGGIPEVPLQQDVAHFKTYSGDINNYVNLVQEPKFPLVVSTKQDSLLSPQLVYQPEPQKVFAVPQEIYQVPHQVYQVPLQHQQIHEVPQPQKIYEVPQVPLQHQQVYEVPLQQEKVYQVPQLQQQQVYEVPLQQEKVYQVPQLQQQQVYEVPVQQEKVYEVPRLPLQQQQVYQVPQQHQQDLQIPPALLVPRPIAAGYPRFGQGELKPVSPSYSTKIEYHGLTGNLEDDSRYAQDYDYAQGPYSIAKRQVQATSSQRFVIQDAQKNKE